LSDELEELEELEEFVMLSSDLIKSTKARYKRN
jgi:hypothetical protein